uniref:EF-hand and coiled-coil domain containing 1 n=1 Tax=Poecilia reticulata TaxID=8081 RepID=A0A3P9Q8J2_POERE
MDATDSPDPYSRPARRTQWIVSTLAYHYGLDRGVENEIIVLATGLDQYLQEIFHHLDHRGLGKIPEEDFNVLCEVLGLSEDSESEESAGVLDNLPSALTFRHFHAKLCGYFTTKAGCQYENDRLLVGTDSEHIETQIRLRSPLKRRETLLSVGAAGGGCSPSPSPAQRRAFGCRLGSPGSCSRECYEEIVALEEAEDRIGKLEDENASLRELVEDMRAALQSSDARCLALQSQVGLWKSHSKHKPREGRFVSPRTLAPHNNVSNSSNSNLKSLQNLIHEIEYLHSSREWQVEETVSRNQRLEQELWSCKEAVAALEDSNRLLKTEQASMRRKVEEARQALLSGLEKVKDLEAKASRVPALQRHVVQMESELLYYCQDLQHDRRSPTGRAVTTPDKEEQLFRSVEGQAASDEEEDKRAGDQQRQVEEVKRILTRLSCCGGCGDEALEKLMFRFGSSRSEECHSAVVELLERVTRLHKELKLKESRAEMNMDQMKDSLVQELQQRVEDTELLTVELQSLEREKVRLSLVEEKLVDILQLLQQLRDLNVSRRTLGKMLLSTLESGNNPQHKAHILEVLSALYHELAACEILSSHGRLQAPQSQQSLHNLIISC